MGSLFEFIRAKWVLYPHTGKYTTACARRFLSYCSSPQWYFQRYAMKPLKLDPIVVIVHSTFLFWNRDLCERRILAAISRNIESKLGANYEQVYLCSAIFPGVMISLEQVIWLIHTLHSLWIDWSRTNGVYRYKYRYRYRYLYRFGTGTGTVQVHV